MKTGLAEDSAALHVIEILEAHELENL